MRKVKIVIGILIVCVMALGITLQVSENVDDVNFLRSQLEELETNIEYQDRLDREISEVGVAWHLDHMLKVINRIYDNLESSNPEDYQRNINFTRMAVFISGSMPRGRGKAPKSVTPPENIKTEDILSQLLEARQKLSKIDSLHEKANFEHPVFGQLNRKQSKRFIEIHTNHHLKIIKDILAEDSLNE